MGKLYFEVGNEESCYPLDYFIDRIRDGEESIMLALAKIDYHSGYAWCTDTADLMESGDGSCGKYCKKYSPRNGKSGRCRLSINTYINSNEEFILTKTGIKKYATVSRKG